jgi:hypothetical protein
VCGAVVAVYTEGLYRSGDLDFVLLTYMNKDLPRIMQMIGFEVKASRHYSHPECKHLIVEFASGPPGIGEDMKIKPAERKANGTVIKIYSPTDCIRDRLASYIHFGATECMDQAVLVAQRQPFDLKKVEKWCRSEGYPEAFQEFERRLKSSPRSSRAKKSRS